MANNKCYFSCFSINFHRFLKANGLKYISKGIHSNGKTFWVYLRNQEFENLFQLWGLNKPL